MEAADDPSSLGSALYFTQHPPEETPRSNGPADHLVHSPSPRLVRTLVTGATGFIGSVLVRRLVSENRRVRVFRRSTSSLDLLGDVASEVEHAVGDVTDPFAVREAVADVNRIYHLAAAVDFRGKRARDPLHAVNVEGTAHVVNAALEERVDRLVHASSVAALGPPQGDERYADESSRWQDGPTTTEYARSKHAAELEVYRGEAEGVEAVIVNPALVFGPEDPSNATMRIVERVREERLPGVPPGGTNVVDVLDVVDGFVAAMDHGRVGERYYLGSEPISWRDLVRTLARAFDATPPERTVPVWLLKAIGWISDGLSASLGIRTGLTRELARTAVTFHRYDNEKARRDLSVDFRPFEATARRLANAHE